MSLGFGEPLLLEDINLQIERGVWVGLPGRKGIDKVISDDGSTSGFVRSRKNLVLIPPGYDLSLA